MGSGRRARRRGARSSPARTGVAAGAAGRAIRPASRARAPAAASRTSRRHRRARRRYGRRQEVEQRVEHRRLAGALRPAATTSGTRASTSSQSGRGELRVERPGAGQLDDGPGFGRERAERGAPRGVRRRPRTERTSRLGAVKRPDGGYASPRRWPSQPRSMSGPLTPDRFADLAALFGRGRRPEVVLVHVLPRSRTRLDQLDRGREPRALEALSADDPGPRPVAYERRAVVGWVSLGPREDYERLDLLRRSLAPVDDTPVWSIVCFVVSRDGARPAASPRRCWPPPIELCPRATARRRWRPIRSIPAAGGSRPRTPSRAPSRCSNGPGSGGRTSPVRTPSTADPPDRPARPRTLLTAGRRPLYVIRRGRDTVVRPG